MTITKLAKAVRAFILVFLGLVAPVLTLAQAPLVAQPPPPIGFESWRLREANEVSEIFELSFPSAFKSTFEENNRVPIRAMLPVNRLGRVPVVILLHYWGAGDWRIEQAFGEELNRKGIGAVLMALPFHLGRTPAGSRSGELAIRPDPAALVDSMTQSVWDVRRTVDWVQSKSEFDANRIGIAGTSLGGIVSSLSFNLEPRLSCGLFLLAGVDIAEILWKSSRVVSQREGLRRLGYTEDRLRDELRLIEPMNYAVANETRKTYVVGARFDTIIPRSSTEKLITMLDQPEVLWLDTGHVGGFLVERQVWQSGAKFFDACFAGRKFVAPTRFFTPTIRLGVQATGSQGIQIAAGIDLWRSNNAGDGFAAALVTPRGAQGFLGYKIAPGVAIGVSITPKRTSWGVFWNLVL